MTGNPAYDFVPPARDSGLLGSGGLYDPAMTLVAASPQQDFDPYDLGELHVMLDHAYDANHNYSWVFAFQAAPNVTGTVRYGVYLDVDHQAGSGATTDPLGKPITVDPLYLPDYVLYVDRIGNTVSGANVDLYHWNGSAWDAPRTLAAIGGDAWFVASSHAIHLLAPYTAIGTSSDAFAGSLAVTVFSTSVAPSDGVRDAVPVQGATLDNPALVSDMLMPLYPFDTPFSNPTAYYAMPSLRWRMPYYGSVDGYQVQVARDASFTDLVETWETYETGTSAFYSLLPAAFQSMNTYEDNESYYWRVRLRHEKYTGNSYDYGPWSPRMRFKLSSRQVGNPTVSTGDLAQTTPSFAWERVESAAGYTLQVDNDANFSSPILNRQLDATSYTPQDALPDGLYYWRVAMRRNNNVQGQWTPTFSLVKQSLAPMASGPVDSQVINGQPTFSWSSILTDTPTLRVAAPRYQFQLDDDPNFSSPSTYQTEATSYTPVTGQSLTDGTWYWRVAMIDANNHLGAYGPRQQFYKEYLRPQLLQPQQGSADLANLYFAWTPLDGAATYKLETADNDTFNRSKAIVTGNTRYTPTFKLTAGAALYWRVQMLDADNKPGPFEDGRVETSQAAVFLPLIVR